MSQRSAFKTRQRAREGIMGRRKIDSYILQTRTAKMAHLVAMSLKKLVAEEVCYELDRRGYPMRECCNGSSSREVLVHEPVHEDVHEADGNPEERA